MDDPPILRKLLEQTAARIEEIVQELLDGGTVDQWYDAMAEEIALAHTAAALAGYERDTLSASEQAAVARAVDNQYEYLDLFAVALAAAYSASSASGAPLVYPGNTMARSQMYGQSSGATYWSAKYADWALPAMPRDGTTQCLSRCKCQWQINELAGDGNADCYWRMSDAEHCQTCKERAALWSPLRIRGGDVQI